MTKTQIPIGHWSIGTSLVIRIWALVISHLIVIGHSMLSSHPIHRRHSRAAFWAECRSRRQRRLAMIERAFSPQDHGDVKHHRRPGLAKQVADALSEIRP